MLIIASQSNVSCSVCIRFGFLFRSLWSMAQLGSATFQSRFVQEQFLKIKFYAGSSGRLHILLVRCPDIFYISQTD